MKPIESISTDELRRDLDDAWLDIAMCEKALAVGAVRYGNGRSVRQRLEINERVRDIIVAELAKRVSVGLVSIDFKGAMMTEQELFNCETETEALMHWWEGVALDHSGQLVLASVWA